MDKLEDKNQELVMQKREVLMADEKRYLIYYTFNEINPLSQTEVNKEDV